MKDSFKRFDAPFLENYLLLMKSKISESSNMCELKQHLRVFVSESLFDQLTFVSFSKGTLTIVAESSSAVSEIRLIKNNYISYVNSHSQISLQKLCLMNK